MLPDTFPWWGLLALATAAFTDVVTDLLPAGLLPQMSTALHVPEALVLTGHQAMYTYVAPFAPGRTGVVLLVFGGATVAGIWITGVVADRYLRPVLLADGLVPGGTGAAALPWVTLVFTVAALGTAGAARRTAFPPERREERGIPGRVALLPRA